MFDDKTELLLCRRWLNEMTVVVQIWAKEGQPLVRNSDMCLRTK